MLPVKVPICALNWAMAKHRDSKVGIRGRVCFLTPSLKFIKTGPCCHSDKNVGILIQCVLQCGLYKSYGQQGFFKVAPFDGLIFIYQTNPVRYASKRVFLKFIDFELYKLYCASYLCRGIGQTSCSFEHVSCWEIMQNTYFPDRGCVRTYAPCVSTPLCRHVISHLLSRNQCEMLIVA